METVQLEQIANNLMAKLEPACVEVLNQGANFVATEALYLVIINIVFFMVCFIGIWLASNHYLLCKLGKCYKTYKEAEKHVEEDVKFYKNM